MGFPRILPEIATLVTPAVRSSIDAAADGSLRPYHYESLQETLRAVRQHEFCAVLVSPETVSDRELSGLSLLAEGFPGLSTVAIVNDTEHLSSERLLELGVRGVNNLVDVSRREGWRKLREILLRPSTPHDARILEKLVPELGDCTRNCRIFFEMMVKLAPEFPRVMDFTRFFGVHPSTFVSRFYRAGLPSPKRYLAGLRLVHAALYLEMQKLTISDVSHRLEYSSPQSFGRHVRQVLGITATEFRRRYSAEQVIDHFVESLIRPFRKDLETFDPIKPGFGGPDKD